MPVQLVVSDICCFAFKVRRWERRSTKRLKTSTPSWKASARRRRTCSSFFYVSFYSDFFLIQMKCHPLCWPLQVDCCKSCCTGMWVVFFFPSVFVPPVFQDFYRFFVAVFWSQVMVYFTRRPLHYFGTFSVVLITSLIVHNVVKKCKKCWLEEKQSDLDCFLFLF